MALAESLKSMDSEIPSAAPAADIVYRCNICGIESPEVSCFAGIATQGPHRLSGTCITCNLPFGGRETWRRVVALILLILTPTTFLVLIHGSQEIGLVGLLMIAALIHPFVIALHELGHAISAKVLELDVNLITLGAGRFLWAGNILSFPVRFYAWPLSGMTYLGGHPSKFMRMRVWLTILMGPTTNFALIFLAIVLWNPLGRVLDSNITLLWIIYNAMMGVGNLWPRRFFQFGQVHSTDGMQLFQIPFKKDVALAESLGLGPASAIYVMYKDGDYLGAKKACFGHLQHLPGNPWLLTLLSACYIDLGDYEPARLNLDPLLDSVVPLPPQLHAAVQNNLALALWLRDFNSPQLEQSMQRAGALAADAYRRYPCVLAHRSTRALLLTAANRSEEALALLDYMNYGRASPDDRSHREFARAFAYRKLGRCTEAEQALAAALKLRSVRLPYLRTIGLIL
jgi:hypothetical protein